VHLTYLTATATPSPTTSSDTTEELAKEAAKWWNFLLGAPLTIAIIIAVSLIVLMILRKLINKVTDKLANGVNDIETSGGSERTRALRAMNPLVNARRAQRSRTIGSVLRSVASLLIGTIAVLLILDQLNVNIAPILASASVVGVALGFGAQSLVKDFLSGIFLILEDQYGVGDNVEIGDVSGTVESIALRITKVRDSHGTLWYLRNGEVLKVGNKTHGWAMATVEVKVPYDSDLAAVRAALKNVAATVKKRKDIAASLRGDVKISGIESMSSSAVALNVQVKTLPARQWEVARVLREEIRAEFESQELKLAD
jgi:small conductance mechanosensitive channel